MSRAPVRAWLSRIYGGVQKICLIGIVVGGRGMGQWVMVTKAWISSVRRDGLSLRTVGVMSMTEIVAPAPLPGMDTVFLRRRV